MPCPLMHTWNRSTQGCLGTAPLPNLAQKIVRLSKALPAQASQSTPHPPAKTATQATTPAPATQSAQTPNCAQPSHQPARGKISTQSPPSFHHNDAPFDIPPALSPLSFPTPPRAPEQAPARKFRRASLFLPGIPTSSQTKFRAYAGKRGSSPRSESAPPPR